jgi:alkanesulfonate monooxygenase SsuD/methylene tetrahydromethanopterin reductase-like flavin-dependent oxidoreductase (luciferase family)
LAITDTILAEARHRGGTQPHFEAVSLLGAMTTETKRAKIGCLVFYPGYRNPASLAKAATTIDHLSGGRFEIGLGAGWHEWEARAYGYDFPPLATRFELLEESLIIVRALLTQDRTTYKGKHFRVDSASCLPAPLQKRLPIWVGGLGEKKTLRLTAKYADGWNAAYASPQEFKRLGKVLDDWCHKEDRDPKTVRRAINLSFHLVTDAKDVPRMEAELKKAWGPASERMASGALFGTVAQAAERLEAYRAAGADLVTIALRAPWDQPALDGYLNEVVPKLKG